MKAVTDALSLVFTDNAFRKVKDLIEKEGNPNLKLRVFVTGGGKDASGFQYGFAFDEEVGKEDAVQEQAGITLLIDPMSYQYLVGAEIDYSEGPHGSQFVIRNRLTSST